MFIMRGRVSPKQDGSLAWSASATVPDAIDFNQIEVVVWRSDKNATNVPPACTASEIVACSWVAAEPQEDLRESIR